MSKLKICGLTCMADVEIVNKFQPDFIGFIFAPSKRQITLEDAKILRGQLISTIKVVGVFVNESIEVLLRYEEAKIVDYFQLHGNEDLHYMASLKKKSKLPIIKAVSVEDETSIKRQQGIIESHLIDYILLDTYSPKCYGGSGQSFDWQLLELINRPYFLAGGIGTENIQQALTYQPYAIDVSSKVETAGKKDKEKIEQLLKVIKEKENS